MVMAIMTVPTLVLDEQGLPTQCGTLPHEGTAGREACVTELAELVCAMRVKPELRASPEAYPNNALLAQVPLKCRHTSCQFANALFHLLIM